MIELDLEMEHLSHVLLSAFYYFFLSFLLERDLGKQATLSCAECSSAVF